MKNRLSISLRLTMEGDKIQGFFTLLQHGFMVDVQVGCCIKAMLYEQFGLSPEYVEDWIQTIFLDGKTVDDIDSAIIRDGSTLALSAAMPGLAGATLRRGGYLALLRSQTTHREEKEEITRQEGMVVLMLFNLVLSELGPTFLKRGILIGRRDPESLLKNLHGEFCTRCRVATMEGKEIGLDDLLGMTWLYNYDYVMLRVHGDL